MRSGCPLRPWQARAQLGAKPRGRTKRPLATRPTKTRDDPGVRPTQALAQASRGLCRAPQGRRQRETGSPVRRPTSPAACSFAAHRPESLETAWRGRRGGLEQRRGREGTSGRNGWRTGRARTGRDPAAPALPLPGREPALPSSLPPPPRASLRRADKGTRDSSNRVSRPRLDAGGRSHAEPSLPRTQRIPVPGGGGGPGSPGGRPTTSGRRALAHARPIASGSPASWRPRRPWSGRRLQSGRGSGCGPGRVRRVLPSPPGLVSRAAGSGGRGGLLTRFTGKGGG